MAAITRTSTVRCSVPPTGVKVPSCSTRSSLTCSAGDMSPISSRKKLPPSAISNRPFLSLMAPVKAPLTWPNRALSSRLSLKAEQFWTTKDCLARGPLWWMARATSSLPVPDSPWMRMVESDAMIFSSSRNTPCIARELPMMLSKRNWLAMPRLIDSRSRSRLLSSVWKVCTSSAPNSRRSCRCSSSGFDMTGILVRARSRSVPPALSSRIFVSSDSCWTSVGGADIDPPTKMKPARSPSSVIGQATTSKPRWHSCTIERRCLAWPLSLSRATLTDSLQRRKPSFENSDSRQKSLLGGMTLPSA